MCFQDEQIILAKIGYSKNFCYAIGKLKSWLLSLSKKLGSVMNYEEMEWTQEKEPHHLLRPPV